MQDFKKKREFQKKLFSKPILFILIIILVFITHGTWGIWQKSRQSKNTLEIAQVELDKLNEREKIIKKKIEKLDTETGLEEEIRSKFDVAREGEQIIVIVDSKELPPMIVDKPKGIKGIFTTIGSWFQ